VSPGAHAGRGEGEFAGPSPGLGDQLIKRAEARRDQDIGLTGERGRLRLTAALYAWAQVLIKTV
jgi:hypothetical protein